MKSLGYGEEYRYAHDEPDAYAAGEDYFPEDLEPRRYYQPVPRAGTEDPRQAGTPGRAGSHQSPPTQKILSGMGSAELARLPRRRR